MSLPLVFHPEVRGEIHDAYVWYDSQRTGLGEEFLTEVQVVLGRIRQNPELHAMRYRDVRRALLKRFSYAVYYRVEQGRISVIAVHHGQRDPKRWQSRA